MNPTYEDITKYCNSDTKLLAAFEYYAAPIEIRITKTLNDGEFFKWRSGAAEDSLFSLGGGSECWAKATDVQVLALLTPHSLQVRLTELELAELAEQNIPAVVNAAEPKKPIGLVKVGAIDYIAAATGLTADQLAQDKNLEKHFPEVAKALKARKKKGKK